MLSTPPAFVLSQDQTLHKIYEEPWLALNYLLKKLPIAMLFIPIDVLNKKLNVSQTSGFNHVAWLFALFSFQRTICFVVIGAWALSGIRFKRLIYLIAFSLACQELFWSFFEAFRFLTAACQSRLAGLFRCRVCQRLVLYYTSLRLLSTPFLKKIWKSAGKLQFVA